jgi:flagellar biogenesis protein FliO
MAEGEHGHESGQSGTPGVKALSQAIHIGVPIASVLVILAFILVLTFPPDKSTIPPESTTLFIPIYLTIVVVMVFGSMYLFKRVVDTPAETTPAS